MEFIEFILIFKGGDKLKKKNMQYEREQYILYDQFGEPARLKLSRSQFEFFVWLQNRGCFYGDVNLIYDDENMEVVEFKDWNW